MAKQHNGCEWKPDEDGIYDTDCNERFEISEGTPKDNKFVFCPYCGKPIVPKEKQND